MRKALTITLVAALALFAGSAAYANYCARDAVPASTILVPWAVQDMAGEYTPDISGYTTVLNIMNVSREAQLIHITVWNALSDGCLDFNEVLTGYDHWQIFFRDMIAGNFGAFDTSFSYPPYPSGHVDPDLGYRWPFEWGPDGRSAYHPSPPPMAGLPIPETTWGGSITDTDCQFPYGTIDVHTNINCLRAPLYARSHYGCDVVPGGQNAANHYNVRNKFVGNDWLAKLAATPSAADPIWFYVTVDVVDQCNFLFPGDDTYFSQRYENVNVLIGDIFYLSAGNNYSEAITAVHIESDPDGVNLFNFYEEKAIATEDPFVYTEPLATALAFEWYNNQYATSAVMMWKNFHEIWFADSSSSTTMDNKVDDCGAYLYYAWDENEHTISRAGGCTVSPCSVNDIDPNEFPFETQLVPIDNTNFDLPDPGGQGYGWMLVIFPPSYGFTSPGGAAGDPTYDNLSSGTIPGVANVSARPYMAWAGLKVNYGSYSAALEAATLASALCYPQQVQPQLGVGVNYTNW